MTTEAEAEADPINDEKLNDLVETSLVDLGATVHAALAIIGDELGLYEALDEAGPLTPAELAERTDTAERYVAEWLRSQAAGDYVTYDPETHRRYSKRTAHALSRGSTGCVIAGSSARFSDADCCDREGLLDLVMIG